MKRLVRVGVTLWALGVFGLAAVVAGARSAPPRQLTSSVAFAAGPAQASRPLAARAAGSPDAVLATPAVGAEIESGSGSDPGADPDAWSRPIWYPASSDVEALPLMSEEGPRVGPSLRARSAFVYDLDAGRVLFEKNADNIRPVASITKLVSSLTFMSLEPNLDDAMCVTAAQYPSRSGARSRLSTGDCLHGWDVIGAALVASDNRAAIGLAAAAGTDVETFVQQMNAVSAELGMDHSSWSDPSGLEDENLSTARDIARATVAVAAHPVLSMVASAPFWDIQREGHEPRRLFSTDRMVGREDLTIEAAKTGYTDTAHYCFTTVLQTDDGHRLVVTLLGADGKMTRWADMNRVLNWVNAGR